MDRLIINVRVSRSRRRFVTYTNKRHHGIIYDLYDWKWGIGIDKVKRNFKYKT